MPKILAISGSDRDGSWNRKLVEHIANLARGEGAEVDTLARGDINMPIYNADEETASGLPQNAASFRSRLRETDGIIISCPEYNGFVTPLLLNAIDWATRSEEGKPDPQIFGNKVILICSTSPGGFGGMRASGHLRTLMSGIGCWVMPQGIVVPGATSSFDDDGALADEDVSSRAQSVTRRFVDMCGKIG
jgi:NAD(P)H-dependent FMN reductase